MELTLDKVRLLSLLIYIYTAWFFHHQKKIHHNANFLCPDKSFRK